VQVEGAITDEAIEQLQRGVMISVEGKKYKTKKAIAMRIPEPELPERNPPIRFRKNVPTTWLSLTLTEGKNRQVRKMTAATGFPTLRLVRHAIGRVTMDGIAPGTYRELDQFPL
jgi:23S rRNA pseudouridine2457 synthase